MTNNEYKYAIAYLLALAALAVLIFSACSRKVYEHTETVRDTVNIVRTDTFLLHRSDTVRIIMRQEEVSIDVPKTNLLKETRDTVSVLSNELYVSVAKWVNGTLSHSLYSLPGAKISGKVIVGDTTRISNETQSHNSENTTAKTHNGTKYVYKEKQLSQWQRWKMDFGGWAMGVLAVLVILFVLRLFNIRIMR